MSETVHRIVPSMLLHGNAPFIFVTIARDRKLTSWEALPVFARDVLLLLGVGPGNFHLIAENTVVEELFVAEQGSELNFGPKPGYLDDLQEYVTPRLDALHQGEKRPKKVYVSRSMMSAGHFLGERYLEEQLKSEGFSIVYPERLPISVQMDLYRKADVLVFSGGSACHGVELLGTGALQRCYLITRGGISPDLNKVLQPRSGEFAISGGHPLLGTAFLNRRRAPSLRFGVTLFDTEKLLSFFRTNSIARLPNFNEREYFRAAEADLRRYLRGTFFAQSKLLRWVRHAIWPNRTVHPPRRGARQELIEAFRTHIDSTL